MRTLIHLLLNRLEKHEQDADTLEILQVLRAVVDARLDNGRTLHAIYELVFTLYELFLVGFRGRFRYWIAKPIFNPVYVFFRSIYQLVEYIFGKMGLLVSSKTVIRKYPDLSLVGVMIIRQQRTFVVSFIILIITLFLALMAEYLGVSIFRPIQLFVFGLMIVLALRMLLVSYRIRKGIFGENEYEAKEILSFILENSDRIDFTDGGKPKEILSFKDLEGIKSRLVQEVANIKA